MQVIFAIVVVYWLLVGVLFLASDLNTGETEKESIIGNFFYYGFFVQFLMAKELFFELLKKIKG